MSQRSQANMNKQPTARVLACVSCQQRKIRCNRMFPCANCQKQGSTCVPATQTRQRRKRFPERELLERLRRYETLLRQNHVEFEPLHKSHERYEALAAGSDDEDGQYQSPPPSYGRGSKSPPTASMRSDKVAGVRSIWHAVAQESPNDTPENTPVAVALESSIRTAWDELTDGDNYLFSVNRSRVNLSTFHPDAVSIFGLWQLFIANVDPLLKVTHTPTLQGRIVEAMRNLQETTPDFEALLFGIYSLAVNSLSDETCKAQLGQDKEQLLTKYQFGCQQALMNANYLRSRSRDCLTALYMYLLAIPATHNPRSLSIMLASAIRTAQSMGIHREAVLQKHSPFEAEMRRRLWWSLVVYDARMSEKADFHDVALNPIWDCNIPLSCNDSDLWPDMKELPKTRNSNTDSIFAVVRSEMADYLRNSHWHIEFTNPRLRPIARELPHGGSLDALEARLETQLPQGCDSGNALHFFVTHVSKAHLLRFRLWAHYAQYLKEGCQTDQQRDAAFSYALQAIECDTLVMSSNLCAGYHWYMQSYFPFPAYLHILQHLRKWPLTELAPRAWKAMHANITSRPFRPKNTLNPLAVMFENIVFWAWDAFSAAAPPGVSSQEPELVQYFRRVQALRRQATADGHTQVGDAAASAGRFASNSSVTSDPPTMDFTMGLGPFFGDTKQVDGLFNDMWDMAGPGGLSGDLGQDETWFMPT